MSGAGPIQLPRPDTAPTSSFSGTSKMTADEQYAGSVKYIPHPYAVIPLPSGDFALMRAYGHQRNLIKTIPAADLASFFSTEFEQLQAENHNAITHRPPRISSYDPLANLSFSSLNIDFKL
jgi:hypothetical protein